MKKWWEKILGLFSYGNYGGPGWSAGKWLANPTKEDLETPPIADYADSCFKTHDKSFNDPEQDNLSSIVKANIKLILNMIYGVLKYTIIVGYCAVVAISFLITLPFTVLFFIWRDYIRK